MAFNHRSRLATAWMFCRLCIFRLSMSARPSFRPPPWPGGGDGVPCRDDNAIQPECAKTAAPVGRGEWGEVFDHGVDVCPDGRVGGSSIEIQEEHQTASFLVFAMSCLASSRENAFTTCCRICAVESMILFHQYATMTSHRSSGSYCIFGSRIFTTGLRVSKQA